MAVKDTTVKYLHSGMSGSPTLGGTAGYTINVLDACLVNGFNSQTITSLVISGNIATLTKTSHGFEVDTVINISGATPSELNRDWRIDTVSDANTLTFETSGISDQTATGTIVAKYAPLNWEKSHSGTNLAAYKGLDPTGTGFKLKVDDTGTTSCRVVGYETMSYISDTSGSMFPTSNYMNGGFYWQKSDVATTASRAWVILGNGKSFYYSPVYYPANTYVATNFFGDFPSRKAGDPFNCIITGQTSALTTSAVTGIQDMSTVGTGAAVFSIARPYTGVGLSVSGGYKNTASPAGFITALTYSGVMGTTIPNPCSGELILTKINIIEATSLNWRGEFPGIYFIGHTSVPQNYFFHKVDKITGVPGISTRKLLFLVSYSLNTSGSGFFIDISGPWG